MRRRRHTRGRRPPTTLRSGVIMLVIGGVLLHWAFLHRLPFVPEATPATIEAEFASAANVNSRTPVRIRGVTVGEVERVEASGDGRTSVVVMALGDRARRIREDATARIRMRTFVSGAMYIDLHPGSRGARPLGDRRIGLGATATQVDWDQFNSMWPEQARLGQRQIIKGLANALSDAGAVRGTLTQLPSALENAGTATDAMRGERRGELTHLIDTTGRTLSALSADEHSLGGFIDGAERTFAAVADEREALGATLGATPPALESTTVTMRRLHRTLDRLEPLAIRLRPGARALAPAMRTLRPALVSVDRLLSELRPLLDAAPPALRGLEDAADRGTPLLRDYAPVIDRLNRETLPALDTRDAGTKLKLYEAIGPMLAALDGAQGVYDANGYYLRADAKSADNSVIAPCDFGPSHERLPECLLLNETVRRLRAGARSR